MGRGITLWNAFSVFELSAMKPGLNLTTMKKIAPYGSWKSPISAADVAKSGKRLQQTSIDNGNIYWNESRPKENGRYVIVKADKRGELTDMIPQGFNARTTVHEYGGHTYLVHNGRLWFSNFSDQRIYLLQDGEAPVPVTAESPGEKTYRYAAAMLDEKRNRLICVREDHSIPGEVHNTLAAVSLDGDRYGNVLFSGTDFVAAPTVNRDCSKVAWITWNHPDMSFDCTTLHVADLDEQGELVNIQSIVRPGVSILEPKWSPDGRLYFAADVAGWWNICRLTDGDIEVVCEQQAEFSAPQWELGISTFHFISAEEILTAYNLTGVWYLGKINTASGELENIETEFTLISDLKAKDGLACFFASSPTRPLSIVKMDLTTLEQEVVCQSQEIDIPDGYCSIPETIEFSNSEGDKVYGFLYPPTNAEYTAPEGDKPPLVIFNHGGPTHSSTATLDPRIQYWTSRGFVVGEVNYGGSTGYGTAYRRRLKGRWGELEVDDLVSAGRYLVKNNLADPEKTVIFGSSAGGYNVLNVVCHSNFYKVGVDVYGLSDLGAFVEKTHKFESHYMDTLVGPYPEAKDIYDQRSPINKVENIATPLLVFQGLDDRIVLPHQAELIVEELKKTSVPVAYIGYEGEQHGFRKAESLINFMQSQQYFFSVILGIEPADNLPPIDIYNL